MLQLDVASSPASERVLSGMAALDKIEEDDWGYDGGRLDWTGWIDSDSGRVPIFLDGELIASASIGLERGMNS